MIESTPRSQDAELAEHALMFVRDIVDGLSAVHDGSIVKSPEQAHAMMPHG